MPSRPRAPSSLTASRGNSPCSNQAAISGRTRCSTKRRVVSRIRRSSSDSSRSISRKSRAVAASSVMVQSCRAGPPVPPPSIPQARRPAAAGPSDRGTGAVGGPWGSELPPHGQRTMSTIAERAMDYEVFLLSRIKEEYDRTGDTAPLARRPPRRVGPGAGPCRLPAASPQRVHPLRSDRTGVRQRPPEGGRRARRGLRRPSPDGRRAPDPAARRRRHPGGQPGRRAGRARRRPADRAAPRRRDRPDRQRPGPRGWHRDRATIREERDQLVLRTLNQTDAKAEYAHALAAAGVVRERELTDLGGVVDVLRELAEWERARQAVAEAGPGDLVLVDGSLHPGPYMPAAVVRPVHELALERGVDLVGVTKASKLRWGRYAPLVLRVRRRAEAEVGPDARWYLRV